jgi:hypothetical protein
MQHRTSLGSGERKGQRAASYKDRLVDPDWRFVPRIVPANHLIIGFPEPRLAIERQNMEMVALPVLPEVPHPI